MGAELPGEARTPRVPAVPAVVALLAIGLALAIVLEVTSRLGAPASPGNLAADAAVHTEGTAGVAEWVLRGPRETEGAPLQGERRLVLAPKRGVLELRFGAPVHVGALLVQAGADDRYRIEASPDGRSWRRIGAVHALAGAGLRTRSIRFDELPPLRGLRLRPVTPGLAVLSAVRVYDTLPEGWPSPAPESLASGWPLVRTLGPVMAWRLGIALLGAAAALVFVRRGSPGARRVLALAGLLGLLSGWDFFQNGRSLGYIWSLQNHWDVYHYYLGAKYAPELGYTGIYECTLRADREDGLGELRAEGALMRDLHGNELVPVSEVSTPCRDDFSPERWQAFRRDVAWFRSQLPPARWLEVALDHGYNPSPAWTVVGGTIARAVPLGDLGFAVLMGLDTVLLVVLWGVAWRTFGTLGAATGLVFFGTNFAAGHWWTHGAFLRQGWLALSVLGVCGLARGRPATAGFLLGWATLLRIFPAFFVIGVALRALVDAVSTRSLVLAPARLRFVAGGLAAVLVIGGLSLLTTGRAGAWREFAENTRKHYGTQAVNMMGALSVTAWVEGELGLEQGPAQPGKDPVPGPAARIARTVLALLFAPLVFLALRRQPDWSAAILATSWIPFVTELGSYYYVYLAIFGFLAVRRPVVAPALLVLAAVLAGFGVWTGGRDLREVFVASSACILVFMVWITALFAREAGDAPG